MEPLELWIWQHSAAGGPACITPQPDAVTFGRGAALSVPCWAAWTPMEGGSPRAMPYLGGRENGSGGHVLVPTYLLLKTNLFVIPLKGEQ